MDLKCCTRLGYRYRQQPKRALWQQRALGQRVKSTQLGMEPRAPTGSQATSAWGVVVPTTRGGGVCGGCLLVGYVISLEACHVADVEGVAVMRREGAA